MHGAIELSSGQAVDDRPFTDIAHNPDDLGAMQRILASLGMLVSQPLAWPEPPQQLIIRGDNDGKVVRVVVSQRNVLAGDAPRFVVGFFGHRRPGLDTTILNAVDDDLIHEFPLQPGVLSYSSFELDDGNYVNVVLMDGPEARDHWRTSSRHTYAARDLAPEFYVHIRLQNAVLPRGLAHPEELRLVATKYYDYREAPPWRARRALE